LLQASASALEAPWSPFVKNTLDQTDFHGKNAVESTTSGYCTDYLRDFDDFLLHRMGAFSKKPSKSLKQSAH
jgi:hypothetical protein